MLARTRTRTRALLAIAAMIALTTACDDVGTLGDPAVATATLADATVDAHEAGAAPLAARDASIDASMDQLHGADAGPPATTCGLQPGSADAASDARPPATVRNLLYGVSRDCVACADTYCPPALGTCADLAGCASAGPATGVSRSQLCAEALSCLLPPACAANSAAGCYCESFRSGLPDAAPPPLACAKYHAGCRTPIERAMETTNLETILSSFADGSRPAGAAALLVQCLKDQRCDSCFQGPSDASTEGESDGQSDARADADSAAPREAEAGPASTCGNGVVEGSERCDDGNHLDDGTPIERCQPVDPQKTGPDDPVTCDSCSPACTDNTACNACLSEQCPEFMDLCEHVGNRAKPEDLVKIERCHRVYACVTQTGCALGTGAPVLSCYCGEGVSDKACLTARKGACTDVIEDAFDTQDPTTILNSFTDISLPGGAALSRVLCEVSVCENVCFYGRVKPALSATDAGDAARAP